MEHLDLKHNQLRDLPDELGNLKRLAKLDISHNMIQEIPWGLGNLRDVLTQMNVDHNPIVVPPKAILTKGTQTILIWLSKNEATGRQAKVSGLGMTK